MSEVGSGQLMRAAVALDAGADPAIVEAAVSASPGVQVVGFVHELDSEGARLEDMSAQVVVVACADESDDAVAFIEGAVRRHPERPVIALCAASPNGFVRRVFDAGAEDIVRLPGAIDAVSLAGVGEQIAFSLQKAAARKHGTAATSTRASGRLIAVLGPKGGIGKTLTASNLAVSFAEHGRSAAIVDLDLQFGDVGLVLGLSPDKTIYDLARSSGAIDAEKLEAFMAVHGSGVHALLAPTRPDHASAVTAEFLTPVYSMLSSTYDYVVVDTPPGFTAEVIASIDSSSDICMVGMLDSLSLKNTKLGLETLDLMGYDPERVRLVLNRADSKTGITKDDVAMIVGREPDVLVPSHRDVTRSINESIPIALAQPRSEAGRAFRALAAMYEKERSDGDSAATNGRRGLFKRKRS